MFYLIKRRKTGNLAPSGILFLGKRPFGPSEMRLYGAASVRGRRLPIKTRESFTASLLVRPDRQVD